MTVPSRFRKEMIKAADKNKDGMISVEEMEAVLKQIGAEKQLTHEEIGTYLQSTQKLHCPSHKESF